MAKRHFQLNNREIEQFRQAEQRHETYMNLKRLQAVRLYGTGMSLAHIMDIHNCGESSVREWVQKCQQKGLSGVNRKVPVPFLGGKRSNALRLPDPHRCLESTLFPFDWIERYAPLILYGI